MDTLARVWRWIGDNEWIFNGIFNGIGAIVLWNLVMFIIHKVRERHSKLLLGVDEADSKFYRAVTPKESVEDTDTILRPKVSIQNKDSAEVRLDGCKFV